MAIYKQPTEGKSLPALSESGFDQRDPLAPNYELLIYGGRGAQPVQVTDEVKKYITEIRFEDNADQFDHLVIRFENQIDNFGGGDILSIIDSILFAEGHTIEVKMGWGTAIKTIGAADIVKKTPIFPEGGAPALIVECYDPIHKMARNRSRNGNTYTNYSDSQIATEIGMRNGFDVSLPNSIQKTAVFNVENEDDARKVSVQHRGQSDYEFLKKVAEKNGYSLYTRFNPETKKFNLYFRKPSVESQKEVLTFVYGDGLSSYRNSLLMFEPTLDAYDQHTDFEIFTIESFSTTHYRPIDRLTVAEQKRLKETVNRRFTGKIPRNGGEQEGENESHVVAFKAFGRSFRFPPYKRFKDEGDARLAIEQFIRRQKENFITGNGSMLGMEFLQSRQIHSLGGLGKQFSGNYYFPKVTHIMSKTHGYRTEFHARKVIKDSIVQTPPTLELSENDRTIQRIKKVKDKKPARVDSDEAFGSE